MSEPTTFGPKTARRILDSIEGRPATATNQTVGVFVPISTTTFRNTSSETAPAFGCLKVVGAELDSTINRYVLLIDKPDATQGIYVFNGEREVDAGEYGQSSTGIVRAKYVNGNTPAVGQTWGPSSSWEISPSGFAAIQVYGDLEGDTLYGKTQEAQPTSELVLAQAPSGGIPARTLATPGSATCKLLEIATTTGTGYAVGDLINTGVDVIVKNWAFDVAAADGDRVLQISKASSPAYVVGWSCNNAGTPTDIEDEE